MSVQGVSSVIAPVLRPHEGARPRVEQERPEGAAPAVPIGRPAAAAGLLGPRSEGLAMEPPPGTDPELWQVLTQEERAYFSRMSAMGPLTYGRPAQAPGGETALARGGRIDVRA